MAIYLKKFENHTQYENYINGSEAILPNVSICTTEGDVHYNPSTPTPTHDYVEIGGLKWATMNVGANSITDYGLYFQWGDTQGYTASQVGSGEGQKYFGWADYKYGNGTSSPGATGMTKYNSTDGKTILDASDDPVTAAWGGNWRTPTVSEFQALSEAVNISWEQGIFTLVSKVDSSKKLVFPRGGYCFKGNSISTGSVGYYLSSSLNASQSDKFYNLYFDNASVNWQSNIGRAIGLVVRGILDE